MANNSNSNGSGSKGVGFIGALQIVFIVLKLIGKISWSWLWVLSPTWISFVLIIIFAIMFYWLIKK